jgi:hypothetical protein
MHMYTPDEKPKTFRTRAVEVLAEVAIASVMGLMFAWVLVNWATGCGEVFHTATGTVMGECVFMPWRD